MITFKELLKYTTHKDFYEVICKVLKTLVCFPLKLFLLQIKNIVRNIRETKIINSINKTNTLNFLNLST